MSGMEFELRCCEVVSAAQRLRKSANNWMELSNAIFAPEVGLIAKSFPCKSDRVIFRSLPAYVRLHEIVEEAMWALRDRVLRSMQEIDNKEK